MGRLKKTTRPIIWAMKTNGIEKTASRNSAAYGCSRGRMPARNSRIRGRNFFSEKRRSSLKFFAAM